MQWLATWSVPPPPQWLEQLPVLGPRLAGRWKEAAAVRPDELSASLAPYTRQIIGWLLGTVGTIGMVLVQFVLVVVIAAMPYASGETVADGVRRFARRLAGARGEHSARLAAQAIRGVALGIVGLFVGPVVLAVSYSLLADWVNMGESVTAAQEPDRQPVPVAEPYRS